MAVTSVTIKGRVLGADGKAIVGFKIRIKSLSFDGFTIATIVDDKAAPIEATSGATGEFSLTITDATTLKKLLAEGHALLFKSATYDVAASPEEGLSRATPLYLSGRQATSVVLESVPQRDNGPMVPATPAQLSVREVWRDDKLRRPSLLVRGRVLDANGLPALDVTVTANVRVTGASKSVPFPLPDAAPTAKVSETDGRFTMDLGRAGDLLPYQPYSLFPWTFRVTPGGDPKASAETSASDACHLGLDGETEVVLRWEPAASGGPKVALLGVLRSGKPAHARVCNIEAVGRLLDTATSLPLRGYRVQITPSGATSVQSEATTRPDGYFPLPHPCSLGMDARDLEMNWTLRVLDTQGVEVAAGVAAKRDADSTAVVEVKIALPKAADSSPKIAATLTALAWSVDAKTTTALGTNGLSTLQDIVSAGGLRKVPGAEPKDTPTLRKLEQVADLWSVLPPGLAAADAIAAVKELYQAGITTTAALGTMPRAEVTKRLQAKLGDFKAAQVQAVAAARSNLLRLLVTGARVEAGYAKPATARALDPDVGRSILPMATIMPEPESPLPACSCEGCQTAVSPNAYLVDLIRYASARMNLAASPVTFTDLQTSFHQPFADLPMSCASMDTPVLVSRIAIEALRSYATTLDPLSTEDQADLDARVADYVEAAYEALLAEVGITTSELRLAQGDTTQLTALADRLGLPSSTEVEALLLGDTTPLTEANLESLFGLRTSTRLPLDTIATAQVLTWRTQRLKSAWAQADQIAAWSATEPLVDPDILDSAYLRYFWDATNVATIRWQARRTAINTQLANNLSGRVLAVGAAIVPVAQPALGRAPNTDEKWAAYLTVTLSQDEVDSKAATLAPALQDTARKEAAKSKTLATKRIRTGNPAATLSAEELATIDAVLAYVGTGITTAAQTASVTWAKGLFEALTPSSGTAGATEADWNTRHSVLKGTATTPSVDTVKTDLATFTFSVEPFIRIWDLYLKNKNQGFRTMTEAEWSEFDAIWVARWKKLQAATWLTEETTDSIAVTADLFWKPESTKPQALWLGSLPRLQKFLDALDAELVRPIVEPDLLAHADFVDTGGAAYTLFDTRKTWITTTLAAFMTAKTNVNAALPANKVSVFDTELLAPALGVKATAAVPASPAWYEAPGLQAAYDTGNMPLERLDQLLISRAGFNAVFKVRSLLRAQKPVTDREWTEVFNILLQVKKIRKYGAWRREEALPGNAIVLSPDHFALPTPPPITFPPPPAVDRDLPSWRATAFELTEWRTTLAGRIQELSDLQRAQRDLVLRVEERVLIPLRDALVIAYAPLIDATLSEQADWLTDRLLIDFKDGPTSRTTRIAHAITTLQLLLFSASTGQLFRLKTTGTASLYPDLTLHGNNFASEWRWMGEYGSWRSAIFVFMYPENLLYPSLRSPVQQSHAFQALLGEVRDSSPLTPDVARQIAGRYQTYFYDVTHLTVEASATVRGRMNADGSFSRQPDSLGAVGDVIICFATSPSGAVYYCLRDLATGSIARTFWNPIPTWKDIKRFHGAALYLAQDSTLYVVLVAGASQKAGNVALQVMRMDLSKLEQGISPWDAEPSTLDSLPPESDGDYWRCQYRVEQQNQDFTPAGTRQKVYIYACSPKNATPYTGGNRTSYYRRPLNETATAWASGEWYMYLIKQVRDAEGLLAAFAVDSLGEHYAFLTQGATFTRWGGITYTYTTLVVHSSREEPNDEGCIALEDDAAIGHTSALTYRGCTVRNPGSILIWTGSHVVQFFWPAWGWIAASVSLYADVAAPNAHERNPVSVDGWPYVSRNGSNVETKIEVIEPVTYWITSFEMISRSPTSDLPSVSESRFDTDSALRRDAIYWYLYFFTDATLPLMLAEATFSVPVHLALQLQQAGQHEAALAWWRSVYDWTLPSGERKIASLLRSDESTYAYDYHSLQQWLTDPFNPHAVAGTRPLSYARFTLLALVRAFLEYADGEFGRDTVESLPKARTLYQMAQLLLAEDELHPAEDPCEEIAGTVDFSFVPGDWEETLETLLFSMRQTMGGLEPEARKTLVTKVRDHLKDTGIPKWSTRFAKARAAIQDAAKTRPAPAKIKDLVKQDVAEQGRWQMQLRWGPGTRAAAQRLSLLVGRRFRATMAALTGVDTQVLDAKSDLKFDWLTRRVRVRKPVVDQKAGVPILVQPATAVGVAYRSRRMVNPLQPTAEALGAGLAAENPEYALASMSLLSETYVPGDPITFCIPQNPVLQALRLRAELNLYKLRTGRNISGQERAVEVYAAPTDAQTGLPTLGADGRLMTTGRTRLLPTQYRYPVLIERARRLVNLAAQFEQQLLSSLEKKDNEERSLMEARNNLSIQRAMLSIKNLEVQDASLGVDLVVKQQERNEAVLDYFTDLLDNGLTKYEQGIMASMLMQVINLTVSSAASGIAASAYLSSTPLNAAGVAQSLSTFATMFSTQASLQSVITSQLQLWASWERREQEWKQQKTLATLDGQILDISKEQATNRVRIKSEEQRLTASQVNHAESVVDFLVTKFTSKELYEWMSRILQSLYASQLQQATSLARLAQQQLSFELLQDVGIIQGDYWTARLDTPALNSQGPDRRGLTGSARLAKDIEQLDVLALQSDQRRLQLTRTISLANIAPGEFQRFRESGEMWFETKESDFDLEFPGHYFRRIRKVRISMSALVPPQRGIRATLTNIGSSRVTVPGTAGFDSVTLPPSHDAIALTSPVNATGLFEMDIQPELRLPFEGVGVDTAWHLELPRPANPIDYASIADVFITFEYTALYSPDYRAELMQNPQKLPRKIQAIRAFSFRNELADQWYELHNAVSGASSLPVSFTVSAADFPAGLGNIRVQRLSLYLSLKEDERGVKADLSQDNLSKVIRLGIGASSVPAEQAFTDSDHLIMARTSADPWFRQLPSSRSPYGTYTLTLPATQAVLDLFRKDLVLDLMFAISYEADLPPWPSGQKPSRLF